MENYREYLPELKSTTLFQEIDDDALVKLLEAMQPEIIRKKKGEMAEVKKDFKTFRMVLRVADQKELVPRPHRYDMPQFGEPGRLMAEIPCLSCMFESRSPEEGHAPKKERKGPPFKRKPLSCDTEFLELSGEMVTKYYGAEVAEAQGIMLRNLLGILAQKVCDEREEKWELMKKYDK